MITAREGDLHGEQLAAVETRLGIDHHVGGERDVIAVEEGGQLGRPQRVEHDERLARALEVAVEDGQLLGEEALARAGDDEHGGLDRHVVADERHRADLVVLLLEDRARGRVALAPVRAVRVALAVPEDPADRLPLLAGHLEEGCHEHFLAGVGEHPPAALALDHQRAVRVDPVLPGQRRAAVDVEVLDVHPRAARRHLPEEVADEEVARVLRAQEGHDVDGGGEAIQDLAPLVGERVAALGCEIEPPRPPVEDRLRTIGRCADAGYPVRVMLMPIIPIPDWQRHSTVDRSRAVAVSHPPCTSRCEPSACSGSC